MRTLAPLIVTASLCLPGCIFVADDTSPAPRSDYTGTLVVDWTVDGSRSPDECDQGDAVWLELTVYSASGRFVTDYADACDAFSTSIELDPDSYYAEAVLQDADGNARTTVVDIDDFTIRGLDSLSVPIDFPASSFY